MADNKRVIATLKRLIAKYGDVPLSQAMEREAHRGAGAPRRWDIHRLMDLYLDVEAAKASGMKQRQACKAIAIFNGLKLKAVEKRFAQARSLFHLDRAERKFGRAFMAEVLNLHLRGDDHSPEPLPGRPRLIAFLRGYKAAAETPRK